MKNLISMATDGVSMGKKGLELGACIVELLTACLVEQRRTNTALVALLAYAERANPREPIIARNRHIKESQS